MRCRGRYVERILDRELDRRRVAINRRSIRPVLLDSSRNSGEG